MTIISQTAKVCTVIVTVDAQPEYMDELEAHARRGLISFADFDGFISGALHKSSDGTRLVQYLQWQNEDYHRACVEHPRWDSLPSAQRFLEIVRTGRATMDVRIYDVLAQQDSQQTTGNQ